MKSLIAFMWNFVLTLMFCVSMMPILGLALHWLNYDREGDSVLNAFFSVIWYMANWSI